MSEKSNPVNDAKQFINSQVDVCNLIHESKAFICFTITDDGSFACQVDVGTSTMLECVGFFETAAIKMLSMKEEMAGSLRSDDCEDPCGDD